MKPRSLPEIGWDIGFGTFAAWCAAMVLTDDPRKALAGVIAVVLCSSVASAMTEWRDVMRARLAAKNEGAAS